MRVKHIGFRVRGFYHLASLGLIYDRMSTTTKQKLDVLLFGDKHGLTATIDHASVSRATLYAW